VEMIQVRSNFPLQGKLLALRGRREYRFELGDELGNVDRLHHHRGLSPRHCRGVLEQVLYRLAKLGGVEPQALKNAQGLGAELFSKILREDVQVAAENQQWGAHLMA